VVEYNGLAGPTTLLRLVQMDYATGTPMPPPGT
jgi:hypothetical protein